MVGTFEATSRKTHHTPQCGVPSKAQGLLSTNGCTRPEHLIQKGAPGDAGSPDTRFAGAGGGRGSVVPEVQPEPITLAPSPCHLLVFLS